MANLLVSEAADKGFAKAESYCKDKLARYERGIADRTPCAGSGEELAGPIFRVRYAQWKRYCEMRQSRPMDDGTDAHCGEYPAGPKGDGTRLGNGREPAAEFLNRVVQIAVRNDVCWREGSQLARGAAQGSPTVDDAEPR